jgi:hypothetical protein
VGRASIWRVGTKAQEFMTNAAWHPSIRKSKSNIDQGRWLVRASGEALECTIDGGQEAKTEILNQ